MINLIDMKLPKRTKDEIKKGMMPTMDDQDQWPYGLKLDFEKEQVDKMPSLKNLNVGDKVSIQCQGSVIEVRMSERQGGGDMHNVCIQIEKVGVEPTKKKKLEEMSPGEYREERMKKN
jgi:hypothetical protein